MADDLARVYFPFPHNWKSSYTARFEFLTEILTSEAGIEQRLALRSSPRRTITMAIQVVARDFARFQRLVGAAQNIPVVIPDFTRGTFAAAVAAGSHDLTVDANGFYVGQEVIVGEGDDGIVGAVAAVAGSTITLTNALPALPAHTPVRPALTAYWPADFAGSMSTDQVLESSIELAVDPLKDMPSVSAAGADFNSREVFAFDANWRRAMDVRFIWPVETVDYDRGPIVTFQAVDFGTTAVTGEYLFGSSAEAWSFIDFFKRMKGRRGAFYKANDSTDMTMVGSAASGDSFLFVEGTELGTDFNQHPVFNAIQIDTNDDSTLRHNITNIVTSFENSRLTLDPPLSRALTPAEVRKISWLVYSRFAADAIEMSFVTDQIATLSIAIQSLPSPSDEYAALRSTLEGDDRETLPGDDRVVVNF